MQHPSSKAAAAATLSLLLTFLATAATAATLTVTNTADSGNGSLRQAVNSSHADDTIVFDLPSLPAAIVLTSGYLELATNLTVIGPGASLLKISGNTNSRIFLANGGAHLTLEGLHLTSGRGERGGAIYLTGQQTLLTLRDSELDSNLAFGNPAFGEWASGGAIFAGGAGILIERCLFHANVALGPNNASGSGFPGVGGAIAGDNAGSVTIRDSTFSNNLAIGGNATVVGDGGIAMGGALRMSTSSPLLIERSTFSANSAKGGSSVGASGGLARGGGIQLSANQVEILVRLSTFSANVADGGSGLIEGNALGGGVFADTPGAFELITVKGNQAISTNSAQGGGLALFTSTLKQSIVSGNLAGTGPDVYVGSNPTPSLGYNIVSSTPGGFSFGTLGSDDVGNGTNPLLGALIDNGGPTKTHALLAGSPALDAIPAVSCAANIDQRQVSRPQGSACDIGAYEDIPPLFADGFESGSTAGWSQVVP